jgi:hypothetical protein
VIALAQIFSDAKTAVAFCKNMLDLMAKIKNDTAPDPNKISPKMPISLLLGLLDFAPFEIDIRKLLVMAMCYDGSWKRTKSAMRFVELWNAQVTQAERAYIVKRLMETDDANAAHLLALYSEKIVKRFSDDPELITETL